MKPQFCQSCGMPINEETRNAVSQIYCRYCTNESGDLKPREAVQAGVCEWLKMFAPEPSGVDFMKRADNYLKAMPAWAE